MGRMVYVETEQVADTTTTQDTLAELPVIIMGGIAPAPDDTEADGSDSEIFEMMGEMSVEPGTTIDADTQGDTVTVRPDEIISASGDTGSEVAGQSVVPAVVIRPGDAEPGIR